MGHSAEDSRDLIRFLQQASPTLLDEFIDEPFIRDEAPPTSLVQQWEAERVSILVTSQGPDPNATDRIWEWYKYSPRPMNKAHELGEVVGNVFRHHDIAKCYKEWIPPRDPSFLNKAGETIELLEFRVACRDLWRQIIAIGR